MATAANAWPELDWNQWSATADTLHMWTQIVGKTRLELHPLQAHWWNVPLYVSARGLSTAAMPYGSEMLEVEFDFVSHALRFRSSTGTQLATPLHSQTVAAFFTQYLRSLEAIGMPVELWPMPVEVPNPIRFDQDNEHATYDRDAAYRFWRVLTRADQVFQRFSASYIGKVSPVHFFWGSFDLAVTRFSGKLAPPRPDADPITREAYSHEVISAGFWPGNGGFGEAAFYCYAAPQPPGFDSASVLPAAARYNKQLGEFILPYEAVRTAADPDALLMQFLESTYQAAANLGGWDRASLERAPGRAVASPKAVSEKG